MPITEIKGARKLMKPKQIFDSPGKTNYKNPRNFLYRVKHTKFVLILKCNTVQVPYLQRNFILKCCHDLCAMWKIST